MAGVYETFEERDGGKGAIIGHAEKSAVELLTSSTFVLTDAGVKRFAARQFNDIDFISYRPSAPSSVSCGTQTTLPIYATYRPGAPGGDVDGDAVAIELLPDSFR